MCEVVASRLDQKMPFGELRIDVEDDGDSSLIRATGEIDLGSVHPFRAAVSEALGKKPASVTFDLRQVTYIDSSGLGVLVTARRQMGRRMLVMVQHPSVVQAFRVTGLDRVINLDHQAAESTQALGHR